MHRALRIPELVAMICGHIFQYPLSFVPPHLHQDIPTLYAFARTCKLFSSPSLDILWSRQYGLQNFIKCMPSGVWEEPLDLTHGFHLVRPIVASDWERPSIYAPRLRQIVVTFNDFRLLDILGLFLPCEYLFANLDTIRCVRQKSLLPHIRLLLGPKIHTVMLDLVEAALDLSLLPVLSQRYPALRDVTFKINLGLRVPTDLQLQSISLFARRLTHIEALTLDSVDPAAFRYLGQLSTLKSLTTGLAQPQGQMTAAYDDFPRFPALRVLKFRETTTQIAASYIGLMSQCTLTTVDIEIKAPSTAEQSATLYSALTAICIPSAVHSFFIKNSVSYSRRMDDGDTYVVPSTALQTLSCFANLTTLALQSPMGFDLNDALIAELAQTWPRLQFCMLLADAGAQYRPWGITLVALRAFAQHCPDLGYLGLTFDATVIPPRLSTGSPHIRPIQEGLLHLDVTASPASDAASVAGYLSGLFPRLWNVAYRSSDNDSDDSDDEDEGHANAKIWAQVNTLLPLMQGLREEEKAWANQSSGPEEA
ncbi:hypothetical protein C8R43DRAFT_1133068 [Mycena crocata]|nr:hypothetical protein C8R43DRAFT_1133068 [Mycena crocata]